jgi:hypothetical protein
MKGGITMEISTVNILGARKRSKGIRVEFDNKHIQLQYVEPFYLKDYRGTFRSLKLWLFLCSKDHIRDIWTDYLFRFMGIQIVVRKYL